MQEAIDCSLDQIPPDEEVDEKDEKGEPKPKKRSVDIDLLDLFHKKRTKGWWPVYSNEEGERELMVGLYIVP